MKDLAPVAQVVVAPVFLTVNSAFSATNLKELIAYGRAHPRGINYSTPGIGSSGHLAAEMFSKVAGIEMVHVPFKGADGVQALLSNDVQLACFGLAAIESHVAAGKLRILATTTPRRSAALPNIPTLVEAGVPDYEFSSSMGFLAPAGTPAAVISKLNESIAQAIADPTVAAKLASFGTLAVSNPTPERFAAVIREENQKLGRLIKTIGLKLE
jgi:tripartite-type tricarboxylate transporter receptor subunit TctC